LQSLGLKAGLMRGFDYYITNSFLQKTIEIMREQEAILSGIIRFSTSAFFNRTDKKQGEKDE